MKKLFLILGAIVIVLSLCVGLTYWTRSGIGGGGQQVYIPDTIKTTESTDVNIIVTATGGGGNIQGRFTNLSFHYRLVGEDAYKTLQPKMIPLPDNFKVVQTKKFQSQAYQFVVPPYPKGVTGYLEYYTEVTFDGHESKAEGYKKVKVSDLTL